MPADDYTRLSDPGDAEPPAPSGVTVGSERRLDGVRLFSTVRPEIVRKIEQQCHWREYASNERILDRDNDDGAVSFIVRGRVQIVNYSLGGREVGLARIGPGGYFGELAAIDGEPRSASVIALDNCLLATIPARTFNRFLIDEPELAAQLLRRLACLVRACDDRIMDLSTLSAGQRVYLDLLRLAKRDPEHPEVWMIKPLPAHKEIASQASTTRETVARAISRLDSEGIVKRQNKSLLLLDRTRLERLAAEDEVGFDDGFDRRGGADRRSGGDRRNLPR